MGGAENTPLQHLLPIRRFCPREKYRAKRRGSSVAGDVFSGSPSNFYVNRILIEFVHKTHYILMYIVNFPALFVG